MAGSVFLVALRCWENRRAGLKDEGQLSCLQRRVNRKITVANLPAAHWPLVWSLYPGTNAPGASASLLKLNVLVSWNNDQETHLRSLHEPQGRRTWQEERLQALLQHWPLGGPWNPTQRRARLPREARLSSRPQTSEHWHSDAGTEFSRTEARPGLYPGLHVLVHKHRQV